LLVGQNLSNTQGFGWHPKRLTYDGYEFLETVRDGEVWRGVEAGAEKAGGGITVLIGLGKAYAKQVLAERLGLDLG
jgi:Hypothetical protein (DUF2513)